MLLPLRSNWTGRDLISVSCQLQNTLIYFQPILCVGGCWTFEGISMAIANTGLPIHVSIEGKIKNPIQFITIFGGKNKNKAQNAFVEMKLHHVHTTNKK